MADTSADIVELIKAALESRLLDVHVAIPGIVRAYDASTETCTVEVVTLRPLDTDDGDVVHEAVRPIQNVPVGFWGGTHLNAKFDLAEGDTVLLVFSEWSFARWRESGQVSEPGDLRQHSPAYPVALPWWRPNGRPGADAADSIGRPGGLRLRFGASAIGVGGLADFVALAAKVDARLDALEQAFNTHTHPVSGSLAGVTTELVTPGSSTASTNLKAD